MTLLLWRTFHGGVLTGVVMAQSREGALAPRDAVAHAGASVDGGDEDQEGRYAAVPQDGVGVDG